MTSIQGRLNGVLKSGLKGGLKSSHNSASSISSRVLAVLASTCQAAQIGATTMYHIFTNGLHLDLPNDSIISKHNLIIKRPKNYFEPKKIFKIIGKKIRTKVKKYQPVKPKNIY